jgi:hypothetical protein
MKRETAEDRIQYDMQRCKHFNGTMSKRCRAGVEYDALFDAPNYSFALPCFPRFEHDQRPTAPCALRVLSTREEAEAHEQAVQDTLQRFSQRLVDGQCPHCGRPVERERQVGSCVYAEPCGHRMYQGRAKRRQPAQPAPWGEQ